MDYRNPNRGNYYGKLYLYSEKIIVTCISYLVEDNCKLCNLVIYVLQYVNCNL